MASSAAVAVVGLFVFLLAPFCSTTAQPNGPKPKMVKCQDKNYPQCYHVKLHCPPECSRNCYADCQRCAPVCYCDVAGGICQDPRFIGGDGLTFYFHGKRDHEYCIVSDSNLHINAHFIGRRNPGSNRDFTWIQAIGILFGNHSFYLGALKTAVWNDAVDRLSISFDNEPVILPEEDGAMWTSATAEVSVSRMGTANQVVVEAKDRFRITGTVVPISAEESRVHSYGIPKDDCFAHLELAFKFYSLSEDVHGVLGQTYRNDYVSPFKVSVKMPVMGGEAKFAALGIFSTDCQATRFARENSMVAGAWDGSMSAAA